MTSTDRENALRAVLQERREACVRLNMALRKASRSFRELGELSRTRPMKRKKI